MSGAPPPPPPPPTPGDSAGFSMFYVIIGCAALLSAGIFPFAFVITLRYYRRLSSPPLGARLRSGDVSGGRIKPQQDEPKLFDVYIKPGFEVDEARFGNILPVAVRAADAGLGKKQHAASDSSSRSRGREVDRPEAPTINKGVTSDAYDVAVLITMPTSHPRVVDHWDELGEYAIGTLKLPTTSVHP